MKQIMSACSLNQEQLADVLGASLDRVKSLTSGRVKKLKPDETKALVEKLHLSGDWLATGEGDMFKPASEQAFAGDMATLRQATEAVTALPLSDDQKRQVRDILFAVQSGKTDLIKAALGQPMIARSDHFIMVPRYDVQASAGAGALIHSELVVDYLAFRQEWVSKMGLNRQMLALIEVHGDSMEPSLCNSDLILIDRRASELSVDGIYAIQHRGHLLVKRIQVKLDGTVIIKSDNPAYEPEVLGPEEAESLVVVGRVVWFGRGM